MSKEIENCLAFEADTTNYVWTKLEESAIWPNITTKTLIFVKIPN